jgi:formate C-acetyltransferase/4-hydroxyphenylacetate decarboxylase large subunit
MYPFFKNDTTLATETALEYLEALRVKMTMIEYVASMSWEGLGSGNLFQNMILGGVTEDGARADNALSLLVVQAAINCRTTQPTLSVWYDPKASKEFLIKCVECVKTGVGFPAWFNFKVYAMHEMEKSGVSLKEVRRYAAMGGCTEPTMGGMSYGIVQPGFINHMKLFELALNGGKDLRTGLVFHETALPTTYEELLQRYKEHMEIAIKHWQAYWNYVMAAHRNTVCLVYSSCLVRDCIGRGQSMDDGGALVNGTPTTLSTGLVNVANSFAVVKTLCDGTDFTLKQLAAAMEKNWEGNTALQQRCLDVPKWGNNDDNVDEIFVELWETYCKQVAQGTNFLGEKYDPSMLAISTHAPFGRVCGATPDGRCSGETLADGVTSPFYSTDKNGPFAVLLSAAKVDHSLIRGGLHNMKFHPTALRGDDGSKKLLDLITTYFQGNSFQIQFNVVDSQTLKEAQAHPEQFRDLIVRVAGFSAFFVELSKPIQDEVIKRTEFMLA